jgi:hypothetical protein
MEITVQQASTNDLAWSLEQLKKFSDFFTSNKKLFPDQVYAETFITNLINNHVFLIAKRGEECLGLIAGQFFSHPFNPSIRVLAELFWWVDEVHRKGFAGAKLLKSFIEIGKANVDWITFGLEHNSPVSEDSILRRGFKLQERNYLMEIN